MLGLRTVIILPILAVLILADSYDDGFDNHQDHRYPMRCNPNPNIPSRFPPCSTTTASTSKPTTTTTADDSSVEHTTTANDNIEDVINDLTALERAHWCRFSNGTYVPYGLAFFHTPCSRCHCTKSRSFQCQVLQCMATYCADNSKPVRPNGECCTRCATDPVSNSCVVNGTIFPHGTIVKAIPSKMQCWCQLGNIECRQYIGTLFDSFNIMANGSVVYIIIIVIISILLFGLLICCCCTMYIFHFYQRNQQSLQEVYDQYMGSAGWQPMDEEETVVDPAAEEKRLEAEKNQLSNENFDTIPPPYDVYNGAYVDEQEKK